MWEVLTRLEGALCCAVGNVHLGGFFPSGKCIFSTVGCIGVKKEGCDGMEMVSSILPFLSFPHSIVYQPERLREGASSSVLTITVEIQSGSTESAVVSCSSGVPPMLGRRRYSPYM